MSTTNAFNNQPQDATTGKQQQPGVLEQIYNLATNAATAATTTASNSLGSMTGPTDTTTNYRNQQPHVGGVGDMGTKSEADVARLPEERANPNPYSSGRTSESLENPNITNPTNIQQRLNARDPPNPYPEGNAGVGHTSDKQFRNQQEHVGGVGDLGTKSDADVARLPEERANPDPLASRPGDTNPFRDTTSGAATGFAGSGDRDRDTTEAMDIDRPQSHGWKPDQKSWDTRNVVGTMHDPTQHGHSGGMTGSNIDNDHGLGMPHRRSNERGNRDEGAIGQHTNIAGATDFNSERDAGFKADTRDQGVNEQTQAPVGVDTTSGPRRQEHSIEGDRPFERSQAPFERNTDTTAGHRHREDRDAARERADERSRDRAGVDTTSPLVRHHRREKVEERHDEDDTTSPTGKTHPSKMDKLHGKIMVAKGKLTKDQEAIAQGQRLQTEGVAISPDDFVDERRE